MLLLLVGVIALVYALFVALQPWMIHIGGAFTPTLSWSGYGMGTSVDGQHYAVYFALEPYLHHGSCMNCRNNDFTGSGELCTPSEDYVYTRIDGSLHGYLSTDGARMQVNLYAGKGDARTFPPDLNGAWQGPTLTLSDSGQLDHYLDSSGRLRAQRTSGTDANVATFQVRQGSRSAFHALCKRLAS